MNSPEHKNLDDDLDCILRGLRETEAPAGMERRILQRLEAASAVPAGRRRWIWTLPALGTVAAALLILLLLPHHRPAPTPDRHPSRDPDRAPSIAASSRWVGPPPTYPTPTANRVPSIAASSRWVGPPQLPPPAAETNAPTELSILAPPMPLTDQEKLLLRIAHHPSPGEYAALNPESRDLKDLLDRADYEAFFAEPQPPTPGTTGDDQWQPARN